MREVNSRPRFFQMVQIDVPANFTHDTVILITDPKATAEIDWSEETGEGRVKSLGKFADHESRALLSNGASSAF